MHHDMIYSVWAITSHTLCRAQQHLTIESRSIGPPFFDFVYFVGKGVVALNIWNRCLTAPITRSMWILTLANLRVSSTSTAGNWAFPLVNAGMFSVAPLYATLSCTLNPLSANTTSPGWSLYKYPQFSVMYLSDTLPPYPFDIKLTVPCGVMLIKYLTVLWCL